jgi:hypothetical protein
LYLRRNWLSIEEVSRAPGRARTDRGKTGGRVSVNLDDFDLDAAVLRRSQTDLQAFMEALAVRLEGALPGRVKVERRRDNLFAKTSHAAKIAFHGDKAVYEISFGKAGLAASRAKLVRDVVISSTTIDPAHWLTEVRQEVAALADKAGAAGDALHDFL